MLVEWDPSPVKTRFAGSDGDVQGLHGLFRGVSLSTTAARRSGDNMSSLGSNVELSSLLTAASSGSFSQSQTKASSKRFSEMYLALDSSLGILNKL